ncbi:MAG: hypothetical protein QOK44_3095 [Betaproteobacteria bacterium]|nr:hypothetical protein [Betaproteobacteria bacterium]
MGLSRAAIRCFARHNYPVTAQKIISEHPDMNIRPTALIPQPSALVGLAAIALAMALGLAGCGHQDAAAAKATKSYQGKPDNAPWDDSRWHGDKQTWERAITAREQNQNEYVRIP